MAPAHRLKNTRFIGLPSRTFRLKRRIDHPKVALLQINSSSKKPPKKFGVRLRIAGLTQLDDARATFKMHEDARPTCRQSLEQDAVGNISGP
jgi:hypothetical protein